ncbi:MAG: sulfatase [Chloroflexota bacterium]
MKKTQVTLTVTLLLALFLDTACSVFLGIPKSPANIVFILVDDMRYDEAEFMPNLQKLVAAEGVTFSNFFVNVPNCCPSRATILLGQYSQNTSILTNAGQYGGSNTFHRLGRQNRVFPLWLQAAGYHTAYVGRYLNGFPGNLPEGYLPPGWDDWSLGDTAKTGEIALSQMQHAIDAGKPFFVHISTFAPHYMLSKDGQKTPPLVRPQYKDLFIDQPLPPSLAFNEQDMSDKPTHFQGVPIISVEDQAMLLDHYQKRLQSLQSVDEIIGSVVKFLKDNGKLNNTYIVFTSDNGFQLGEHRIVLDKHVAYEESIHMPFILRGPGVPRGETVAALAGDIDIAATFAEIAGADVPQDVDGVSLLPIIKGKSPKCRYGFLIQYWNNAEKNAWPTLGFSLDSASSGAVDPTIDQELAGSTTVFHSFRGIRTLEFKYVEYITGEKELYLLQIDPYELDNRIKDASPELQAILSDWVDRLSRCSGAACREAEASPPEFDISMLPK